MQQKKKLSLKEKIIFTTLFLLDRSNEIYDYFENPKKIEPYRLKSDLAQQYLAKIYKKKLLNNAINLLPKQEIKPKKTFLLVDTKIFRNTYYWQKFRLLVRNKKWDSYWRVVIFDIPEKNKGTRNFLRRHLKRLGFVFWQKSVWVSIFRIEDELNSTIRKANLQNYVIILKAKNIGPYDNKTLIKKLFPIMQINKIYERFINTAQNAIKTKNEKLLKLAHDYFFEVILQDPGIPDNLFPNPRIRETAIIYFKKLTKI